MNQFSCTPEYPISNFLEKFWEIFANEFLSVASTTPAIKEKNFEINLFIFCWELSCELFTLVNLIFAYFSISGVGKLIFAALSYLNLSAVSLTPVNSFLAVSLTPAINFRLFVFFWPVSTTEVCSFCKTANRCCGEKTAIPLAAGVIHSRRWCHWNRPWKRCIHRYLTHPDQMPFRPLRPPKLLQTIRAISLVANSFIGTAMERRIHRHLTHPDQRPRR